MSACQWKSPLSPVLAKVEALIWPSAPEIAYVCDNFVDTAGVSHESVKPRH